MRASRGKKKKKLDIHKTKELVKRRCATHVLIKSINKRPQKALTMKVHHAMPASTFGFGLKAHNCHEDCQWVDRHGVLRKY